MHQFSKADLKWNTLGVKIIVLALMTTLLASLVVSGIQLYLNWNRVQDDKVNVLSSVESLYLPLISKAYWHYDLEQVESLMRLVNALPYVGQVHLLGQYEENYTAGSEVPERYQEEYKFDVNGNALHFSSLNISPATESETTTANLANYIGQLQIILDKRKMHETLFSEMLKAIPILLLLLFVFSLTCLFGIVLVVSRPIQYLTAIVEEPQKFQLNDLIRNPLAKKWSDSIEIESLFKAINKMRFSIHKQITQKSLLQKQLGRYVKLLHLSNSQLKAVFDSIGDAVVVTDHQFIVEYANQNAMNVPLSSGSFKKGESFFQLLYANTHQEALEGRWDKKLLNESTDVIRVDLTLFIGQGVGGETIPEYYTLSCASFTGVDELKSYVFLFTNVSEHKKMFQRIEYLATHDYLTGTLNRFSFENKMAPYIKTTHMNPYFTLEQGSTEAVLIYINIAHFRVVNDSAGRVAGDELLKQIGRLLSNRLEENDFLARLEGDVFAFVAMVQSKDEANERAKSIHECISGYKFYWGSRKFQVSISVGCVLLPSHVSSIDNLLQYAEGCSKLAKTTPQEIEFFSEDLELKVMGDRQEVRGLMVLEEAIQSKTLRLYLQPIVSIHDQSENQDKSSHKVFELLVRIRKPNGALIYPSEFLPSAEYYKKISLVDRYVVDSLFEFIVENLSWFSTVSHISVNLSGQSLTEDFMLGYVLPQVERFGFAPHKICFEVTETVAINNLQSTNAIIAQMREKGFLFSLDDFGSGLASYGYLQQLPVDYLKIDGSFIKKICDSQVDFKLVESMNSVAHHIGLKTIAEYVESEDILEKLKELNVDYAQGHYYGKAIPIEEYAAII
ncbi:MAG: EAL domain-containing protein [Pseudomonadota bacterium]|nr:EAL domain-containing protein [Pseudomonadota bacterium]